MASMGARPQVSNEGREVVEAGLVVLVRVGSCVHISHFGITSIGIGVVTMAEVPVSCSVRVVVLI